MYRAILASEMTPCFGFFASALNLFRDPDYAGDEARDKDDD